MTPSQCDRCGQFHTSETGSSYATRFAGYPPVPDRELTRCLKCTEAYGPLKASSGFKDWTGGVVE